ncbi:MAG TPA: chemotaxis protein MotB, partial [Bacteroidetes bacterium]|nr:chemotaxis protein MotB [Bacteroidota bacterium]
KEIDFKISKNGIAIRMKEKLLFDLGKADIKPSASPILKKIGALAKGWPNNIRVEGHTDNLPIHTLQFPSNWELSAIRAINVVHFLQDQCQVSPTKIYSIGYGENRPLVPNDSPDNRSKNRRVEIYLEK